MTELDRFDIAILAALQEDGRLTNQELAERAGLSASQCSRRRLRLEASGLVEGYGARLDAERLGLMLQAFVQVSLATHSRENAAEFRRLVAGAPEILDAYAVTGEADYLLRVVAPTLRALSRFLNDMLLAHASVARVHSLIVLEAIKERTPLPLAHLAG